MSTVPCSSCVALCPCRLGFLRFPGGVLWAVILILLFVLSPGIACARFLALYFHVSSLPLGWILHVAAAAGEAERGAAGGSPRAAADAHPAGRSLGTLGVAAGWEQPQQIALPWKWAKTANCKCQRKITLFLNVTLKSVHLGGTSELKRKKTANCCPLQAGEEQEGVVLSWGGGVGKLGSCPLRLLCQVCSPRGKAGQLSPLLLLLAAVY